MYAQIIKNLFNSRVHIYIYMYINYYIHLLL
jgi:hypothetical protein